MLLYVFNFMCAPFQHQRPREAWHQVASKCTCALMTANLLERQWRSIVSRNARGIAREEQLAISTPGLLLHITMGCAISMRSAIASSHFRMVHLEQDIVATICNVWTIEHNWLHDKCLSPHVWTPEHHEEAFLSRYRYHFCHSHFHSITVILFRA